MRGYAPDWTRVKDLFASTFELDSDQRSQLLMEETDPEVRRRVEAMLDAHDSLDGPLDKPAVESLEGIDISTLNPVPSLVGRRLGPYRVVCEVGSGGMGAVYEAVRDDSQFAHRVAIKTLRIGADSETIVKRFHQERRILAGLQHPNIAALYDGAITDDGFPYFVLEYVDGIRIDEFCSANKLDLRSRLELFLQVIAAVQHAHQQLVVHRDLKPTNVLVTADGVVKLVDFGIAKLLDATAPQVTSEAFAPLTIAYASPEQVKGEPITTASDVYSLGVLLYRLLAGVSPLDLEALSLDRAVAALSHETPTLPSTAAARAAADEMGFASVEKLKRVLTGDLDAILMTALRKEPARRYSSAQAFGDDLKRYLDGRPVVAVKDSVRYRAGKFVRRQRALVAGTSIAAAAILGGLAASLWQARTARSEARRAEAVSRFMQSVIGGGDVSATSRGARLGPNATIRELLDSAAARVPVELKDNPDARVAIHLALGRGYLTQERLKEARQQLTAAYETARKHFGDQRIEVAQALSYIAGIEFASGSATADSLTMQALRIFEGLDAEDTPDYARTLRSLAMSNALSGRYTKADSLIKRARQIIFSAGGGPTVDKAVVLAEDAAISEALGRSWEASIRDYRRALAIVDSVPGPEVTEKGALLWYVARAEGIAGRQAVADSLGLEALRVLERSAGPSSMGVAQQLAQLATIARLKGDTAASRAYVERSMKIVRTHPDMMDLPRERIESEFARLKWRSGEIAAAESVARAIHRARVSRGNWPYIVEADELLGTLLLSQGRYAEAEPVLADAYNRSSKGYSSKAYSQYFARLLVTLYAKWNRPSSAKPYLAVLPDSVQRSLRTSLAIQ